MYQPPTFASRSRLLIGERGDGARLRGDRTGHCPLGTSDRLQEGGLLGLVVCNPGLLGFMVQVFVPPAPVSLPLVLTVTEFIITGNTLVSLVLCVCVCREGEEKEEEWGGDNERTTECIVLDHHSNGCCTILHVVHSDTCQVRGITLVISL